MSSGTGLSSQKGIVKALLILMMLFTLVGLTVLTDRLNAQVVPEELQTEPLVPEEVSPEIPPSVEPAPPEAALDEAAELEESADGAEPAITDEQAAEAPAEEADTIALFYLRRCSGCHTIGRGDLDGPDLLPSTKWPRDDLRPAVRRMEKNVGPMTAEQVEGLVDLMKSPDLLERLEEAASRRVTELAAELDPGSPQVGEALFFGQRSFENGGIGCFACHSVKGRGGNLAVDLTDSHVRLGESSLLSATEAPSFPLMKASYGPRPVKTQEAVHIVAYLEAVGAEISEGEAGATRSEQMGVLHGVAGGITLLSLGAIVMVTRSRRAGARSRLIRDSFRR